MFKPMLAASMQQARKKNSIANWNDWAAEEKYDGHRMIVEVAAAQVKAYARGDDGHPRELSEALRRELRKLPSGTYDAELIGGNVSTDVTRLDLLDQRRIVLFDVMNVQGQSTMNDHYGDRRARLEQIYAARKLDKKFVLLANRKLLKTEKDALNFCADIWAKGGEGLILKRLQSLYRPDKRDPFDWVKVKREMHAVLEIVGFEPSRGTVRFPGHPFAIIKLRDKDGNETTVKTLNDKELKALEDEWNRFAARKGNIALDPNELHPALGRRLVIEFQGRTPDNNYRGPVRWDRWAGKGETE